MLEDGILIATLASRNWIKWLEARLIFGMLPRKTMFDLMYHIFVLTISVQLSSEIALT